MELFDVAAEISVLGAILIDNSVIHDIDLTPSDFFNEPNREIFKVMLDSESIDTISIINKLKGDYTDAVLALSQVPTAATAKHHAAIVRSFSDKRRIFKITEDVRRKIEDDDVDDLLLKITDGIKGIDVSEDSVKNVKDLIKPTIQAMSDPIETRGVRTGYLDLDKSIGCFRNSNLIIIGARPGMGKSALALNLMYRMKAKSLFFSCEMPNDELTERMLCYENDVCCQDVNLRVNLERDVPKIVLGGAKLYERPMLVDDTPGIKLKDIEKRIRKHEPEIVFIDHLGLLRLGYRMNTREQVVSELAKRLKEIAKLYHIPIVCLCQLNRKLEERSKKKPILSDLRESGEIEQSADVILFLYRER
jgi:replicative DNA helicase